MLGTKKTIISVNNRELEKLAKQIYNLKSYSFVEVEECGNDSSHSFYVDGDIDPLDQADFVKIKNGEEVPKYCNMLLLNILCADGHIEKGEYVIKVSW